MSLIEGWSASDAPLDRRTSVDRSGSMAAVTNASNQMGRRRHTRTLPLTQCQWKWKPDQIPSASASVPLAATNSNSLA
jgi:hypothetical protein